MNYALIENIAGIIFPFINIILMVIISYQFVLLYQKPLGKMYYRPWHGLMWAFIFFSVIQVLTLLKKVNLIVYPMYVNGILELLIIVSLMFAVHAIKLRKKYDPHHHLNLHIKTSDK
jgi:hypothetical protein|tara:strand:+ start:341 stop:691 length:351 start_codon:yes stop_codon:yes gene_type:complete